MATHHAARAAGMCLAEPDGSAATAQWRALGCDVLLAVTDPTALSRARALLEADLAALDLAASRFRSDSEVAAIAAAGGTPHRVSALLADLLAVALTAAERTDGDLDPTLGADLVTIGYDRDLTELPGVGDQGPGRPRRGFLVRRAPVWRDVALDTDSATVRVPAGVILDLGATAKARCADLSAARLAHELGCGVLVSLGGDLALGGEPPPGGWVVRVQDVAGDPRDPLPEGSGTCLVGLTRGGLATSSTSARRWRHAGSVVHHILDPRTGAPSTDIWRTVSVAAPSCVEANVGSTTAVVRGLAGVAWLKGLGLPARLVANPAWSRPASLGYDGPVLLGGWPVEEERAA